MPATSDLPPVHPPRTGFFARGIQRLFRGHLRRDLRVLAHLGAGEVPHRELRAKLWAQGIKRNSGTGFHALMNQYVKAGLVAVRLEDHVVGYTPVTTRHFRLTDEGRTTLARLQTLFTTRGWTW